MDKGCGRCYPLPSRRGKSFVVGDPAQNRRSSVPRRIEVNDNLARKRYKDLSIPFAR